MSDKGNTTKDTEQSETHSHEGTRAISGPLNVILPPDPAVIHEALKLVGDRNSRVEDLSTCISQDPVQVIEILKIANGLGLTQGKAQITVPQTAIHRLGSQQVSDILNDISQRQRIENPSISQWFELHRSRCKRAAIVARMLAEIVVKNYSEECHVAGLFSYVGEMLAVLHFKEEYVRLGEELPRSTINYRLLQEHKFDVDKIGLAYLRRHGVPELILFAIDREALTRASDRAPMKPVLMAADEMLDAFDSNRWDKLAPGKQLPSKSALRLLQLGESQYTKLYERSSEYLFSMRLIDEKKKYESRQELPPEEPKSKAQTQEMNQGALQDEIEGLLAGWSNETTDSPPVIPPAARPATQPDEGGGRVLPPKNIKETFGLSSKGPLTRRQRPQKIADSKTVPPPPLANAQSAELVGGIAKGIENASSVEQLLSELLGMLIGPGLFQKSALIVVSKDKRSAIVVAARGPSIGNGQTIIIDDPLSPLAESFSKVQSFGNKESKVSPFGSKAFALAPVDAPHDTPVALYADCGNEGSLSFEARRIFRTVVDILNQKLPSLPGGIPIELQNID